jgi:hypothetical protein
MERLKKRLQRKEIPVAARDILARAEGPEQMLRGLDELITRNEVEVGRIHQEIQALETVEGSEKDRVRAGELPDRSRNNALRRIQRLRKQMDNLEERLRIYNRNINLQIHLAGKVQALEAMELRGVDEERIDSILLEYEEELTAYSSVLDSEDLATRSLPNELDDAEDLRALEAEILGAPHAARAAARERALPAPVLERVRAAPETERHEDEGTAAASPRTEEAER